MPNPVQDQGDAPQCERCGSTEWETLDPLQHRLVGVVWGVDARICHGCGDPYTKEEFDRLREPADTHDQP